jgi:hypothetical protein
MANLRTLLLVAAVITTVYTGYQVLGMFKGKKANNARLGTFAKFSALVLLNFSVFWWVVVLAGGDALNGKVVGEQYFLGGHGQYTPVGFGFWLCSLTHAWLTIASFATLFVWLVIGAVSGKLDLRRDGDELHPRGRGTV